MKNLRFRKIKGCIRRLHNQKKVGTKPGFKARAPDSKTGVEKQWQPKVGGIFSSDFLLV